MVKLGGPCQGPGKEEGTLCGRTEIPDSASWRFGKEEHAGKACCTKRKCRLHLKVIDETSDADSSEKAQALCTVVDDARTLLGLAQEGGENAAPQSLREPPAPAAMQSDLQLSAAAETTSEPPTSEPDPTSDPSASPGVSPATSHKRPRSDDASLMPPPPPRPVFSSPLPPTVPPQLSAAELLSSPPRESAGFHGLLQDMPPQPPPPPLNFAPLPPVTFRKLRRAITAGEDAAELLDALEDGYYAMQERCEELAEFARRNIKHCEVARDIFEEEAAVKVDAARTDRDVACSALEAYAREVAIVRLSLAECAAKDRKPGGRCQKGREQVLVGGVKLPCMCHLCHDERFAQSLFNTYDRTALPDRVARKVAHLIAHVESGRAAM